jgi:hypothetical protein
MLPGRPSARAIAIASLLLLIGVTASLAPHSAGSAEVAAGDRAGRAYVARRAAQFESAVLTDERRDEAAARVADLLLPPDPAIARHQEERVQALFAGLRTVRQSSRTASQRLADAAALPGASGLSQPVLGTILELDRASFESFATRAEGAVRDVMAGPVTEARLADRVREYLDSLRNEQRADELAALRDILRAFVVPNVTVDTRATAAARAQARERVEPVIVTIAAGQVVVPEGALLGDHDIEALEETGVIQDGYDFAAAAGALLLAAMVAAVVAGGAATMRPFARAASPRLVTISVLVVASVAIARAALPQLLPDDEAHLLALSLPFAAPALAAGVLGRFSYAATVAAVSGLAAVFVAAAFPALAGSAFRGTMESGTICAAIVLSGVVAGLPPWRRSPGWFLVAAPAIAFALGLAAVASWLIDEPRETDRLAWMGLSAACGGAASAALTGLPLLLFRTRLDIGVRRSLERLARSGHPLLRRLEDEAPGTFHHSLAVATIGETAARRIGADALLVRLGGQFHDIGKLSRPRHFIENLPAVAPSPHDDLTPDVSAGIIRDHVRDGSALAREHGLPAAVADFIPMHHGTRLVSFFYRRARELRLEIPDTDFRYAGPRPSSRETAIVMLADSCEATVRAHQGVQSPGIEALVDAIIEERLAEGELDDAALTVRELRIIAASFKESLRAVYHPRIPYPAVRPEELQRIAQG